MFAAIRKLLPAGDVAATASGVSERFIQLFQAHGVGLPQIPRLLPEVPLPALQSAELLLPCLTPEVIDKSARLFGVDPKWIEGQTDRIYYYLACAKRPQVLLDDFAQLPTAREPLSFPLVVLCTERNLKRRNSRGPELAPVIREVVCSLMGEPVYRYRVFQDGYSWDHLPSRIELKAIARTIYKNFESSVPLMEIPSREMDELLEGRLIPHSLIRPPFLTSPSLEDYALSADESLCAKETDELPLVIEYLEQWHLSEFGRGPSEESQDSATVGAAGPAQSSKTLPAARNGKRGQIAAKWNEIRGMARAIWVRDPTLPIAEVIRLIRSFPNGPAMAFAESAIRKHIVDLAPDGVRGKPGRKPKKSS